MGFIIKKSYENQQVNFARFQDPRSIYIQMQLHFCILAVKKLEIDLRPNAIYGQ